MSQPQRASFRPQLFLRASRTCAAQRVAPRIVEARNLPARWPASLRFARSPRPSLPASRSAATGAPVRPTRQLFPPDRRDGHEAAARPGLGGVEARESCRFARANADDSSRVPSATFVSTGASPPEPLDRTDLASSQRQPHVYPSNSRPDRPPLFLDVQSAASACPP